MLGLNPDPNVKKIIEKHRGDSRFTERYVCMSIHNNMHVYTQ